MTSPESDSHARWWPSAHGFPPGGEDELFVKLHVLLTGFGGRFPDSEVADFRDMVIDKLEYLPEAIVLAAIELNVALTRSEINMIIEISRGFWPRRGDPRHIDQVPLTDTMTDGGHRFVSRPEVAPDYADQAMGIYFSVKEGALRAWRAWRADPEGPRRLFLAEVEAGAEAWWLARAAQQRLVELKSHGRGADALPTVEVFWRGQELPPYHQAALAQAELLWARGNPGTAA